jgi:hypothetical protein
VPKQLDSVRALFSQMFANDDKAIDCLLLACNGLQRKENDGHVAEMIEGFSGSTTFTCLDKSARIAHRLFSVFYLYLIGKFLTDKTILMVIDKLLSQYGDNNIEYGNLPTCRLISYFLRLSQQRIDWSRMEAKITTRHSMVLLKAWMNFKVSLVDTELLDELLLEIEKSLSSSLMHGYSSLALLAYNREALVHRFIETKITRHAGMELRGGCLLTSIFSSDPLKFGPVFFQMHGVMKAKKEYIRIFCSGVFDRSLAVILDSVDKVDIYRGEIQSIIGLFNDRLSKADSDCMMHKNPWNDFLAATHKLLTLSDEATVHNFNTNLLVDFMVRLIQRLNQESRTIPIVIPISLHEQYIQVGLCICAQCHSKSDSIKRFSTTLFVHLCDAVTLSLRVHQDTVDLSSESKTQFRIPCLVWLEQLIANVVSFDLKQLQQNDISFLNSLIKACLRHGMRVQIDGNNIVQISCLQLVQSLIKVVQTEMNSLDTVGTYSMSRHVFNMVTSHSKFEELMSSSDCCRIQLEVIRILFACVSHAADIEFDHHTCTALLACFDAGITEKDRLLRCTIFKFLKIAVKVRTLE